MIDWRRARVGRLWRFLHWKRWQYASIVGADVVAAVAIVDLGWAGSGFAYLFDRRRNQLLADVSTVSVPKRSMLVSDHVRPGAESSLTARGTHLQIGSRAGTWQVAVHVPGMRLEAELEPGPFAATVCAIARVPGGVANCTHKAHGLRVTGVAEANGHRFDLAGSMGALDHTSGLLARSTAWRWASASSDDTAINLVEGFHEPLENTIWRSGRLHALPPVQFVRDEADPMAPWRVISPGGAVDLAFRPEGLRSQDKNLGFAVSRWVQPIGTYRGTVLGQDVGVLAGVIEDHVARW